ncbi:cation:proton antiporter [Actimicrobium sp. CCI2.3]|uniref:cation:proton antiporter n=1 Tax=Actimicrobium sp. CCI2.3 TaxID=3048616 RepID=UPI002AB3BC15|nr:cation:proton antiporter [Actimicrobium sp. CCI2.3]MDY7574148.1 cation:proton antiporter [Actimicrobium sp. CCI2.3]MEB0024059.1 cation:proton antiporter [Actimicrobium sp. CCI2.3]
MLIAMAMMESLLHTLPFSPAMLYLPVGYVLGPGGFGLIDLDPVRHAGELTHLTEIALLISLFTVGLKLRLPLNDARWWLPVRLGTLTMLLTIGLLTAVGYFLLGLTIGPAILLAAIIAPTDPVLASDVQVQDPADYDRLAFSLSGEGGMNDGTTFPFVMIGLGLMGVPMAAHFTGSGIAAVGMVLWGIVAGLLCGWLVGRRVGRLVLYLRQRHRLAMGMEEFLTLGLIALSFGIAELIHGIGFVAVFATGVAMRRIEHKATSNDSGAADAASMTKTLLGFNQQLERLAEFVVVLLLGILLSGCGLSREGLLVALLLLVLIRPVAVNLSMLGATVTRSQRLLISWFGIRGIGSLYYLVFALQYVASVPLGSQQLSERFVPLVLTVVAVSIMAHGLTSTPLMQWYRRRRRRI